MAQPKWYEGDPDGSNFRDDTTGGGGGGAFNNDSTSDTLATGNDILRTTNNNSGGGGDNDGLPNTGGGRDPSTSGANAPNGQTNQNQTQGQAWNWTPNINAARKALNHAGGPGKVGLPANANDAQILAWFREAAEAGGYTENGDSTSDTAYNLSGFSKPGAPDATGMRAWSRQHGMSEDFDRWSETQLMAWEKQKDPNCPPNMPYQAYDGSGCIEKPIDSNNPNAAGGSGGGGGGGGGGQGGGGGVGANTPAAAVQARPDYKPDTNYITQRQVGGAYGPGNGGQPSGPQTGGAEPNPGFQADKRPNPQTQPKEFVINRDHANNQPGGTVIPSSVLWKTGM